MTKPTGNPVGRPKTKEYSTLLARVPQDLVDRVKRYASIHRSTVAELIRDGLEWRITEGDPRHTFLYDTNHSEYSSNTEKQTYLPETDLTPDMLDTEDVDEMPLEPVTATYDSNVTETEIHEQTPEAPHASVTATNSNETDTETSAAASTRPASKRPAAPVPESAQNGTTVGQEQGSQPPGNRKGGRTSTVRQPILDLLRAHPEGLTAVEIKVHVGIDKNIGDTLQGMVRNHVIEKQGSGNTIRYRAMGAPQTPPAAPLAAPVPTRRKRQTQPA